jgi:hypothetical protein
LLTDPGAIGGGGRLLGLGLGWLVDILDALKRDPLPLCRLFDRADHCGRSRVDAEGHVE